MDFLSLKTKKGRCVFVNPVTADNTQATLNYYKQVF